MEDDRPCVGAPILNDPQANTAWVKGGHNALLWLDEHPGQPLNEVERCLAVGFSMEGEINNGGICQWLTNGVAPDIYLWTVSALRRMGAAGMAGHMERVLSGALGPEEDWRDLRGAERWRPFVDRRIRAVYDAMGPDAGDTTATLWVPLAETGMDRKGFEAFLDKHLLALWTFGSAPAYREWFLALSARANAGDPRLRVEDHDGPRRHDRHGADRRPQPIRVERIFVYEGDAGSGDGGETGWNCQRWDDVFGEFGDMGYWYWEEEFRSKGYVFALARMEEVRPELRPKD